MEPEPTDGLSEEQLADLARLADGTLPAERRAEVEARVAASPHLASVLERQGVALRGAAGDGGASAPRRGSAPTSSGATGRPRGGGRRRRLVFGGPIAAAAAVALALVLVLPGGSSSSPSVADTTALGQKPPTQAAPALCPGTPRSCARRSTTCPSPTTPRSSAGRPPAPAHDEPSGRGATTVVLREGRRTIAYTIVSDDALDPPQDARGPGATGSCTARSRRRAHCRHLGAQRPHVRALEPSGEAGELVALADWRGKGAIPF